ncbi:hypothetical protein D9611_007751 [Ephemerocybe angulata]|uniref:alpha-1,2-Mannosidase n=1 Tax=Ephemerocybe angulata TaxID=980116 RepID=A0A8H5FCJ0_9AGAR|nr:hypothetical protein D9611_007751 [Tulosesus angulatus]
MKWGSNWPRWSIALFSLLLHKLPVFHDTEIDASSPFVTSGWTTQRKLAARERTRELWYHGFNNYMDYAYPYDELGPLSCTGKGPDWNNSANIAMNDVAGNFSLTLIDVIDTFVVLDDRQGFERAVKNIIQSVNFDVDTKPQLFETTIRVLGGLLSGHIFANKTGQPFHLPWYRGELLDLALDLGKRLMPAFATPTGLPYARVNLRHGVMKGETWDTCAAGAGTLILEFGTLSRLTGDDRFEKAAKKAFFGVWNRRSDIGLVGNTISTRNGKWTPPELSGIGAGIDSFYEYALKWYIMTGEVEYLDVFDDAYAAVMRYSRSPDGYWFRLVNMNSGDLAYYTVDSLSAFWPGLQVLSGDVENAIKLHLLYYNMWKQHSGLPEVFDTNYRVATSHQYPLRPEFIESTWYLYRATRDPFYLDVAERVLFDLTTRAKVKCGLSGIQDLRNNKQDDRMESFVLSETLKYLYLIFDEENKLHDDDSSYVFTTEGHILKLDDDQIRHKPAKTTSRKFISHQCPAYTAFKPKRGLTRGILSRPDVEYAQVLVGNKPTEADKRHWEYDGWCEKPKSESYSYEFVLAPNGLTAPEDLSPSLLKISTVHDGFVVNNITGIRAKIVQRIDGKGYDVRKLGHYAVRPGHIVYINDSTIFAPPTNLLNLPQTLYNRDRDIELRFFSAQPITPATPQVNLDPPELDVIVDAYSAFFGADLAEALDSSAASSPFLLPQGLRVHQVHDNRQGCLPYEGTYDGGVLVAHRGNCTFLEKLKNADAASAAGVIVISDEDAPINPTANAEDVEEADNLNNTALVFLTSSTGKALLELIDLVEEKGTSQVMVTLHRRQPADTNTTPTGDDSEDSSKMEPIEEEEPSRDTERVLYINGHALLNTRLLI